MEKRIAQSGAARGPLVSCVAFGASITSAIATLQHETLASLMSRSATSASSLTPPTKPFGAKWILYRVKVAEHEARRATEASVDDLSTAIGLTYQKEEILFDRVSQ